MPFQYQSSNHLYLTFLHKETFQDIEILIFHKIISIDCKFVGTYPSQLLEPTGEVFVILYSNFVGLNFYGEKWPKFQEKAKFAIFRHYKACLKPSI